SLRQTTAAAYGSRICASLVRDDSSMFGDSGAKSPPPARSVIHADISKKESRRRLAKDEDEIAAEDKVTVVLIIVGTVDGLAALDTRAIFRRELCPIGLGGKLRGVANCFVVHERQSRHTGDGRGIVCLQGRAKLLDEAIEFLLHGRRSDGVLRLGD